MNGQGLLLLLIIVLVGVYIGRRVIELDKTFPIAVSEKIVDSSSFPEKVQNETAIISSGWHRVDADFLNKDCNAFCQSIGKKCSASGCPADPWCHATGGMMEIESWNRTTGTECDRTWEGKCDVKMDRYPPYFNFHCCCG